MKRIFFYLLVLVFLSFQACSKDQMMVNKIEGEWEIEQIIFTKDGKDSVAMTPGVFSFEKCKQVYGDCPGYYELDGYERVDIGYVVDGHTSQLNINLSSNPEVNLGGKYEIEAFSKEIFSISGRADIYDGEEYIYYDIKMDLKKK